MRLTEFVLARLSEDEESAREWAADEGAYIWDRSPVDPTRMLAECEAKRRIVEAHKPYRRIYGLGCDVCLQPRHLPADAPGWPCLTLRLLALPYADHPDYQQEWRA